jgi:hypothetical protein
MKGDNYTGYRFRVQSSLLVPSRSSLKLAYFHPGIAFFRVSVIISGWTLV